MVPSLKLDDRYLPHLKLQSLGIPNVHCWDILDVFTQPNPYVVTGTLKINTKSNNNALAQTLVYDELDLQVSQ